MTRRFCLQCLRRAGTSGSVFVWVSSSVFGDFAKLPEHAAVAEQLQQAIVTTVFELLAAGLPAMEQHAEMTLEVLDLEARALRRFPHHPQTPIFQVALQFAMVRARSSNVIPQQPTTHPQVAITSRDERILNGVFYLLNNCLSIAAVAPTLVQHYGRQILAEVLPRIKGVYPKTMLRDVSVTLQRMMMQDREGMSQIAMDILSQVRRCVRCHRIARVLSPAAFIHLTPHPQQWPADSIPTMEQRTDFVQALKRHSIVGQEHEKGAQDQVTALLPPFRPVFAHAVAPQLYMFRHACGF